MGDLNNPPWHCPLEENQRGTNLADQINESNYGVLNEDFPKRITPTAHQPLQYKVHHYFWIHKDQHNLLLVLTTYQFSFLEKCGKS